MKDPRKSHNESLPESKNSRESGQPSVSAHKVGEHFPYDCNYESITSPNAQNMRQTAPDMPLVSDNVEVDLSTDPLEGLDEQNDTGSCTGAEFGGYTRYSNGYTGDPDEVKAQNTINPAQSTNPTTVSCTSGEIVTEKGRRHRTGLFLSIAVSAAALCAVGLLANGELEVGGGEDGNASSLTANTENPSAADTPVDVSQEDVPKTENFVLDYAVSPENGEDSTETAEKSTGDVSEEHDGSSSDTEAEPEAESAPAETGNTGESGGTPETLTAGSASVSTPSTPESFTLPLANATVTQPFSNGQLVKSKTLGEWRTHDGLDLAATEGEDVLSIADGLVESVEKNARWGNTIVINYGDYTAFYYGLGDAAAVEVGESVKAGQKIGTAGNSSLVEAEEIPHIHLAIRKDGSWTDPAVLLGLDSGDPLQEESGSADTQDAE